MHKNSSRPMQRHCAHCKDLQTIQYKHAVQAPSTSTQYKHPVQAPSTSTQYKHPVQAPSTKTERNVERTGFLPLGTHGSIFSRRWQMCSAPRGI